MLEEGGVDASAAPSRPLGRSCFAAFLRDLVLPPGPPSQLEELVLIGFNYSQGDFKKEGNPFVEVVQGEEDETKGPTVIVGGRRWRRLK